MQEAAKYKVRPRPASTGGVVGERERQDGFGLLLCGICVLQKSGENRAGTDEGREYAYFNRYLRLF